MTTEQINEMASRAWLKYLEGWAINRGVAILLDRESYIRGYVDAVKALVVG